MNICVLPVEPNDFREGKKHFCILTVLCVYNVEFSQYFVFTTNSLS